MNQRLYGLIEGVRISRVGKGYWLKAKGLRCFMSLGRDSRGLRYRTM